MKESYCIKDKRVTPCTEPSGYQKDKRGRTQFFCRCAVCGIKKVRYVKMGGECPARRVRLPCKVEVEIKEKQKRSKKTN